MFGNAARITLSTICGITLLVGPALADPVDDLGSWAKFRDLEGKSQQAPAKPDSAAPASTTGGAAAAPDAAQQGAFTVPAYFAAQPQPFERPQQTIVRVPAAAMGNTGSGLNAFASTLPFVLSGGYPFLGGGYGAFGWGGLGYGGYGSGLPGAFMGLPGAGWGAGLPGFGFGGYGLGAAGFRPGYLAGGFAPGFSLGGFGPGFGGLGPGIGYGGFYPGYAPGFGGLGGYGWYGNPGFGSLMLGAFGGAITGGSRLGTLSGTRVFQSAPSKASGNYYATSTVDTTASGSFYATTSPAQTPALPVTKPITNFWGSSGGPYGKDTSMPWNK